MVFPADLVPSEVEVVVTTQDGSMGRQGLVTDVFLDYFEWADTVFACGPNPMFAALAGVLQKCVECHDSYQIAAPTVR